MNPYHEDSEMNVVEKKTVEDDSDDKDTPVGCFSCRKDHCRSCCCNLNNYWKLLIDSVIILIYLLLGGLFFNLLERPNELQQVEMAQAEREEAADMLAKQVANFTDMLVTLTNLTTEQATNLTDIIIQGALRVAKSSQPLLAERDPIWDYESSVFFASTVITTIGYGTIAPVTSGGRVLFIFYALLGIPIALIFLTTIASIMSDWIGAALKPLIKRLGKGHLTSKAIGLTFSLSFGFIFIILVPAAILYSVEKANDWTYLISVYFCFVTLTTVGFGDFVPGITTSSFEDDLATGYGGFLKIATIVWLWIGLAFVATLISEIQGLLEATRKHFQMRQISRNKRLMKMKAKDRSKEELAAFPEGGLDKQPQSTETHPEEGESVSI